MTDMKKKSGRQSQGQDGQGLYRWRTNFLCHSGDCTCGVQNQFDQLALQPRLASLRLNSGRRSCRNDRTGEHRHTGIQRNALRDLVG